MSETTSHQERRGVPRRQKALFALVAALGLAAAAGLKAWQVFVEPQRATERYLGLEHSRGPVPEFALESRDGGRLTPSDLRGRFVFLNFWATWCPTCKTEMPSMVELLSRLRDTPLLAIAAAEDEGWEAVDRYLGPQPLPFAVLRDPGQKAAHAFGTTKFPETYLIGPDGRLRARFVGPRDWSDPAFERYLRRLLATAGPSPAP